MNKIDIVTISKCFFSYLFCYCRVGLIYQVLIVISVAVVCQPSHVSLAR